VTAAGGGPAGRLLGIAAMLAGTFLGVLDGYIVTVALPTMRADLHASYGQSQLILAGYTLAYAAGLISGGRLGDRFGRRRVFLLGLGAFTLLSVVCGLATSPPALILARASQGLAAAAMLPQVLSTIRSTLTDRRQDRAVGWYGAVVGLGVVTGPVVGAVLLTAVPQAWGWRAVFLVNAPIGALACAAVARWVRESLAPAAPADTVGILLWAAALTAVLLPVTQGPEAGWPGWMLACLAGAPVLLAAFVMQQRAAGRRRSPLLPPGLFTGRFTAAVLAVVPMFAAGAGGPLLLVLSIHLQTDLGLSPLRTGLIFAPLGLGFAIASVVNPALHRRWGLAVPAAGMVLVILGLLALVAAVGGDRPAIASQAAALLFGCGIGQGLAVNPLFRVVLAHVPPDRSGASSGVLLTATQVATGLGIALIGLVYTAVLRGAVHDLARAGLALDVSLAFLSMLTATGLPLLLLLRGH
jgi:MFS family permease